MSEYDEDLPRFQGTDEDEFSPVELPIYSQTDGEEMAEKIAEQQARIEELEAYSLEVRQSLQWFINRCDNGEVRSTKTYNAFKELVDKSPALSLSEALKND